LTFACLTAIFRDTIDTRLVGGSVPMAQSGSTMQLTRAADYAVRVMIQLATMPGHERAMLPALAKSTGAPLSFLSKVLQALCRAGFIVSRRGQSGGFEILPPGREATIRSVIEAIDGPISLNVCLVSGASCNRQSYCPAHPIWEKAQEAMLDVLDAATVAELAGQAVAPPVQIYAAQSETA
jgi:Rrf2 family protein